MPIRKTHQSPKVGDTFTKTFKNAQYKTTVVKVGKRIGYSVGKTVYKNPSAAAKSITQTAVNGWVFWHMENRSYPTRAVSGILDGGKSGFGRNRR